MYNNDPGGSIDTEEIAQAFAAAGIDIDAETLQEVIEEADEDDSGEVDIFEWIGIQKSVRDGTSKAMKLLAEAALKNSLLKEQEKENQQKKRIAMSAQRNAILKKFSPQRLAMFRNTFDSFDADGSGEVDLNELVAMCQAMEMNVTKKVLKKLMAAVDVDNSGSIEFVEFVQMMDIGKKGVLSSVFYQMAHKHEQMADDKRKSVLKKRAAVLKEKLKASDIKNTKASLRAAAKKNLTKLELAACKQTFSIIDGDDDGALDEDELKSAFEALGIKMKKKEVRTLFRAVDIDGDGSLDLDEYIVCVSQCKKNSKYAKKFAKLAEAASNLANNTKAKAKLARKKELQSQKRQKEIQIQSDRAAFRAATRKKFPKTQLSRLQVQFNSVDADGSGELDEGELMDLFEAMDIQASKKNVRKIIHDIDDDDSGTLDFDEFLSLYNTIQIANSGFMAQARSKIEKAALNGDNGFGIDMSALEDKANLRKVKRKEQKEANDKKAAAQVALFAVFSKKELERLKELFDRLDADRSGKIDLVR